MLTPSDRISLGVTFLLTFHNGAADCGTQPHSRSRPTQQEERATPEQRRRFKQTQSLKSRLLDRVKSLREEARVTKPGFERDVLLRKARQTETAAHMDEWLSSPGLKPPA